jgi:hypothetical protein
MRGDWRTWVRTTGWTEEGDGFWVDVGARRQRVTIVQEADMVLLRSRVARRAILNQIPDSDQRAWQRNRVSELVGFRRDRHGVMLAETPLPSDVGSQEFEFLAFNLARAADRFEHILSGKDEE